MKKSIFALAVIGFGLVSCKKDYSCTCNSSGFYYYDSDGDGADEAHPFANTTNIKIEEANKTQAVAACNEATIKQQDGLNTYEVTCELTK